MNKATGNSNFDWSALNESSCGSLQTFSASILVQELIRLNVSNFIVSPGARSIPLILGLNKLPAKLKNKIKVTLVNDERSAAFFAQGISKAGGLPCLICTTGTAAANYLPGVVEAFYSNTPLLIVTADRPWELQYSGANQTIRQAGIFKNYVGLEIEIPALDRELNAHSFLSNIDQLIYATTDLKLPVHLNISYRKPFYEAGYKPETDLNEIDKLRIIDWASRETPYLTRRRSSPTEFLRTSISNNVLDDASKVMIVAGPLSDNSLIKVIENIAIEKNIPVIADIHSNLRQNRFRACLSLFNLYLNTFSELEVLPDIIFHVGDRLISDEVHKFIFENKIKLISVNDSYNRCDAIENEFIYPLEKISVEDFVTLSKSFKKNNEEFLDFYVKLEAEYQESTQLTFGVEFSERAIIRNAVAVVPEKTAIFLSASLIFREADSFVFEADPLTRFYGNRGATGIDGIMSSAIGTVYNSEYPLLCIIGDQAALHDLNALSLLNDTTNGALILVINNAGGSIFNMMKNEDLIPTLINPHALNFEKFTKGFGLEYYAVNNMKDFISTVRDVYLNKTKTVIEVQIDGKQSVKNLLNFQ